MTLDPGHFHAALVQREMYDEVSPQVHVYAPLGPDLLAHLQRLAGFNARAERPTSWKVEVHAGPDSLRRMLRERPGNVVVLSGRNRGKIDALKAAVEAGLHVLADKPWIISADDLPTLAAALDAAERQRLIAYDIMTERNEITSILQREFVNDAAIFGETLHGSPHEPGVFMESVHYLAKTVAGVPLQRPAWFFDVDQAGEGLADVGTHLVDLVFWILFPNQAIEVADVQLLSARRWPTVLDETKFQRVTGEASFPDYLASSIVGGRLDYYCNTQISYVVRGVYVGLNVLWDYEATAGGGDTHFARFRGTRAAVEVRQGAEQRFRPELYVVSDQVGVHRAVAERVAQLQERIPGVEVVRRGDESQALIPDCYRVGHEAHFGEVTRQFLAYVREPSALPAWEKANMLAKYTITTRGVALARETQAKAEHPND
jgi:predicted dehydrogenase